MTKDGVTTCEDCLCHEKTGYRGCACRSQLRRSHSELYCPKLGKRAQDAKKCPGFHQATRGSDA